MEDGTKFIPHIFLMLAKEFERATAITKFNFIRFGCSLYTAKPLEQELKSRIVLNKMKYAFDASADARIHNRDICGLAPAVEYTYNDKCEEGENQFCVGLNLMLQDYRGDISYFNCGLVINLIYQ